MRKKTGLLVRLVVVVVHEVEADVEPCEVFSSVRSPPS